MALSPDFSYFATGSGDCKARLWKCDNFGPKLNLPSLTQSQPTYGQSLSSATLASISAPPKSSKPILYQSGEHRSSSDSESADQQDKQERTSPVPTHQNQDVQNEQRNGSPDPKENSRNTIEADSNQNGEW